MLNDLLPVLQFIHENKVIHRDIKPENIIRRARDKKLILIDFGVAKQQTKTILSRLGTTVETPGYAPLEQLRGQAFPCSDLYSLAVTCVRLMTGVFLQKEDDSDPLHDIINRNWLWRNFLPSGIEVSEELGAVLDNLLQDRPQERYQSAPEVLDALNNPQSPKFFSFDVITVNENGKEINRQRKQAEYFMEDLGNEIFLEMVAIPGGTFMMGTDDEEIERLSEEYDTDWFECESSQHQVTIEPFYMGKYAITQAQWRAVAALPKVKIDFRYYEPSCFKGANRPVECVSWNEAEEFCRRLSQKTGKEYRLPSEAEWEYACRAGTTTPFHFGETITPQLVNYDGNYPYGNAPKGKYRGQTVDVGNCPPNGFGLYEMHGNVWEWCADNWHDNYLGAPDDGTRWSSSNIISSPLRRGGSWGKNAGDCRSANRCWSEPNVLDSRIGFRVAVSPRTS